MGRGRAAPASWLRAAEALGRVGLPRPCLSLPLGPGILAGPHLSTACPLLHLEPPTPSSSLSVSSFSWAPVTEKHSHGAECLSVQGYPGREVTEG